ncbi:thaumatin-like protein [Roridomyces roridus]|uniref:Thaumatin-like protein n=1 Tax=Roridomyces roridus TaxID=1738132 RepID=A0AAD7BLB7_9AGAR|nr:thaumatin-like protein [Roridomyces roridus]
MMKSFVALAMASVAAARSMTVYNGCPFTVWPAYFTSSGGNPSQVTGWQADAFTAVTFDVPSSWDGRIWARRNCDFSNNNGPTACLDGGCNGGLQCDRSTGTGVPPASLAEFNLDGDGVNDWYDVSFVDGYNLPISVTNNVGCPQPGCAVDLGPNCPSDLKGPFDSSGFPVGCKSACYQTSLDGWINDNPNCCTGIHDTAATCPPSGVEDYSYFKNACPNAYAYAYDESSESALWTCLASKQAQYTVTFCPPA